MTTAETLAESDCVSVQAPAGCGKTHLIAEAVKLGSQRGKHLVLTHTHAGVAAIRKRLNSFRVRQSTYEVDTLAGWCLRLTRSFPKSSGILTARPSSAEWSQVYAAAATLLRISGLSKVIQASYHAAFVDEYQDCTIDQHAVIVAIAALIPTRILGDPLQGIFDFGHQRLVDWSTDVEPVFAPLAPLTTPYRWNERNPELGQWLLALRSQIRPGGTVDFGSAPQGSFSLNILPQDNGGRVEAQLNVCNRVFRKAGTKVAIHAWEHQCHSLARRLGGIAESLETIECDDLVQSARSIDKAPGGRERAQAVFEFAGKCLTRVHSELNTKAARIFSGKQSTPIRAGTIGSTQLSSLLHAAVTSLMTDAMAALQSLALYDNKGSKAMLIRPELYSEMLRAFSALVQGDYPTLESAAIEVRERTRRQGRSPGLNVIGRTLLVKGLEFDHGIVLDAASHNHKNLYVALTRASQSLTVCSATGSITLT